MAALALIVAAAALLIVPAGRWRVTVLVLKAKGALPDVPWSDVFSGIKLGSPADFSSIPDDHNPFKSIHVAQMPDRELTAGGDVYRANCAVCHGLDGHGVDTYPDLTLATGTRGDWFIYRTIRDGVAGTAMTAHQFPNRQAWQLVAYVRSLSRQASSAAAARPATPPVSVPYDLLLRAARDSAGWYSYSGDYRSQRFSRLAQVNTRTVSGLQLLWQFQMPTASPVVETSPIVVGNVMFVTEPPASALALDARTGTVLWRYDRPFPAAFRGCCGPMNRGVAILDSALFLGTLDAHLVALHARTGRVLWDVQVADVNGAYSITSAPLVVKDMVITGVAGGEFGIKGFIDAYDAKTGRRRWRFNTVPGQGQPGAETWVGGPPATAGAPTWLTGSFDPDLNLVYWGIGNPGPDYDGDSRPGDNLYSNSVVALDPDSGRMRWYFQFTPHDEHDWDAVQIPILVDTMLAGRPRKLMAWANRNGFYYLLDRENGRFILANPFVRQTWAERIDSTGRPVELPGGRPSRAGQFVYPGSGATNWWSPSYSSRTGMMYVPIEEGGAMFYKEKQEYRRGENFEGSTYVPAREPCRPGITAIDVPSGVVRWTYHFERGPGPCRVGGVLSSAGDVVFGGWNRQFVGLDAHTGRVLWHFNVGGPVAAAPVSYLIDGRQHVAIAAGRAIMVFGLKPGN